MSLDQLTAHLNALCDEVPFHVGWQLLDARPGASARADRYGDVVVPSASVRKIAILMTALKAVQDGQLTLEQPVTIEARFQNPNNRSGCFQYFQPGFTITLRDVLIMMIIVSDNTATGTVVELVGLDAINAFYQAQGMLGSVMRHAIVPDDLPRDHPVDASNTTTPADVARLLELIVRGSGEPSVADHLGCAPEHCRLALEIMSWQMLNNRLPALLPTGTLVAHKTGTLARNSNDAGVIYRGGKPLFILSAFTEHVPPALPDGTPGHAAAARLIAQLSRECWDALAVD
jgi:beta-lactamase class A